MKKYFKKFGIMFVMLLAMIGFGIIQNETVANAATVGNQLINADDGWKRFDDSNSLILIQNGERQTNNGGSNSLYNKPYYGEGTRIYLNNLGKIKFYYYGSDFRIISDKCHPDRTDKIKVIVDGIDETVSLEDNSSNIIVTRVLQYESKNLKLENHSVIIENIGSNAKPFMLDAIDINDNGYLISPSMTLDKSTMNLTEGDLGQLTATTTPAGAQVTWSSSDPTIATVTVDPDNGKLIKVNALKEGTCTITATTTDGSNLSASCTINVTKKDTPIPVPDNPTNNKTGAILIINLTDGETKVFDVSSSEIDKFKEWYNTKSEYENKLTYEFDKTVNSSISVEEDVVHEKITSYEIRKY